MRYIEGESKYQVNALPKCLDEMINDDNIVRVIDDLVETFDMKAKQFTHSEPKIVGRKAYSPKDMLRIYIYGYFNGLFKTKFHTA